MLFRSGVKIEGIGHRIVQGGWYFGDSSLVDEDVLAKIREVAPLAPLHNNPEANVIEFCLEQYPDLPNVTVYDTAFHFNMPEVAKTYALPKDVCDKLHIRKYGAHGTSYRYISKKVAEMTNGEEMCIRDRWRRASATALPKSTSSGIPYPVSTTASPFIRHTLEKGRSCI